MIVTIIPTIGRDTLERAFESVISEAIDFGNEVSCIPVIGGTAGENRNKGIQIAKALNADWITFLDDDDYYKDLWSEQLDNDYDIVVLRMKQGEAIIPNETDKLRFGNVGINFALNMSRIKWEDLPKFDNDGEGEDWRFLEQLLEKYPKVKITKDIYYVAEKRNYNQ
jgi:hypothetical protein